MAENAPNNNTNPYIPFCLGCSTQFDLDEHAPRFLSECAHSLCISCVLCREPHSCAFCEQPFDVEEARANVDETLTALLVENAASPEQDTSDDCDGAEAVECRSKCSDLVSHFSFVYNFSSQKC